MPPLEPHFLGFPPDNLKDRLKDIGERIHNRVLSLREELFGKPDEEEKKPLHHHDDGPP